jgi:hypothetical protein
MSSPYDQPLQLGHPVPAHTATVRIRSGAGNPAHPRTNPWRGWLSGVYVRPDGQEVRDRAGSERQRGRALDTMPSGPHSESRCQCGPIALGP